METKIIETPVEIHKVELKKYLNAEDYMDIDEAGYQNSDAKIEMDEIQEARKTGKLRMNIGDAFKMDRESLKIKIKVAVVSVDGEKENIVDKVFKFRKPDFDFILEEIEKLKEEDEKKNEE